MDVAKLDAAATRDMLSSCMRLHELSIAESDICVKRIAVLAEQIKRDKKLMNDAEESHRAVTKESKVRIKEEKGEVKELALLKKKLKKDLQPIQDMLRKSDEPISVTKLLLVDLENKKGKLTFSKIEKDEAEMTMAEAILESRARTNHRGSIVQKEEKAVPQKEEEPEIIKMTKMRLKVLEQSQGNLKKKFKDLKKELADNLSNDEKCKIVVRDLTKKMKDSGSSVLETNRSVQPGYTSAISEVHRLQRRLHSCRVDEGNMEERIADLREAAKEKQKEEDFKGLVTETCFNPTVDEELRQAIFDDIQATALYESQSSIFDEIQAKYDFDNNSMSMLRFNLDDMVKRVDDANSKLENNLQHWERDRNTLSGVGLVNQWKLAKVAYEKVKGKVDKVKNMAYRVEPVPEALLEEFERVKER